MNTSPIKQIFIGNLTLKSKLANIIITKQPNSSDMEKVFNKVSSAGNSPTGIRNKLASSNSTFIYYTILSPNIFYLVVVENIYPERQVFNLIEKIHSKEVYRATKQNGELTPDALKCIDFILNEYQDISKVDTIASINQDVDEVKNTMKANVKEILKSTESARELEEKSEKIKLGALEMQENSKELKKETCIQNFKWTLIIGGVIILLALVIIIPLVK